MNNLKCCLVPLLAATVLSGSAVATAHAQSATYTFTTVGGEPGTGSADGAGSAARFYWPNGLALDGVGNVYVADPGNFTVRRLSVMGTNWVSSTIAGLAGFPGGEDGANSAARFSYPGGLAVDSADTVYVADTFGSTIRQLTLVGTDWVCRTIAGLAGYPGSQDGANDTARFWYPEGVAVDLEGKVYVADTFGSTIRLLTPTGSDWIATTIAGQAGVWGGEDGLNSAVRFARPGGVAVDLSGNLYVADWGNNTIRALMPDGTNWMSRTIAGLAGTSGSADGTNAAIRFERPFGITLDRHGNVYVTDSYTIRKLSPVGTNWVSSTIAGLAGTRGSADGTNSGARFYGPVGVAVDSAVNVFVADAGNHTIRLLRPLGTNWVCGTIAGLAITAGYADGANRTTRFNSPSALALATGSELFVADTGNHTLRQLTRVGTDWVASTMAGLAGRPGSADGTNRAARFSGPRGLAVDTGGNVVIADSANHTIRQLRRMGNDWVSRTIAGQAGQVGSADGANRAARFNYPSGAAVDAAGKIYVADAANHTIRVLTPVGSDWVSTTIAGMAGSLGSADGLSQTARFDHPAGVAVDTAGNLYVADRENSTIRKLTPVGSGWLVQTIAGSAGYDGSADGANDTVGFYLPEGVAVDGNGNVYVADTGNNTIRKLTRPNWIASTLAGLPGISGSGDGGGSAVRFDGPTGIAMGQGGVLYVADSGNNTIRLGLLPGTDLSAPIFQRVAQVNRSMVLTWNVMIGRSYQLQFTSDPTSTDWRNLGDAITATGPTMTAVEPVGPDPRRFYRVVLRPPVATTSPGQYAK